MTAIKICGLRRVDDAVVATDAGATMLGFVFAPSRREISPQLAGDIIDEVRRHADVLTVGVFVDATVRRINEVARRAGLDYAQLCGGEGNDTIEGLDLPAIQVLHVGSETRPDDLVQRADTTAAELVMLDTARTGSYGGTGEIFDWTRIPALARPVLLAGGLEASNVAAAIQTLRPWGVDVSSGVETNGVKDQAKIRQFIAAAQGAK